jgi:transposase
MILPISSYCSAEEPDAHIIHITRGYGRDHRPDLNQVMLDLIVEHQAGIPLLMKPLSGNTSDASDFGQVVSSHIAQRWVLLYSEHRRPQAQRTVDKQLLKQSTAEVRALQHLGRTAFARKANAQQALHAFAQDLQATVCSK